MVDDGVNGSLVPVRDPAALADAIRRLGSEPTWRTTAGAASRSKAAKEFDERRVVEIVMETYRQVARRKGLDELVEP